MAKNFIKKYLPDPELNQKSSIDEDFWQIVT